MPNQPQASDLRQQITRLWVELAALQRKLLRHRRMIPASLIERHLGTKGRKRASSAFYLSFLSGGHTKLVHIPKRRCERVRVQVEAWKEYRAQVRRWGELSDLVLDLLRQLGQAQAMDPQELRP